MTEPIIIAIDGPSASGKGTLSKLIAKEIEAAHIDSGAAYRYIGLQALEAGEKLEDENAMNSFSEKVLGSATLDDLSNSNLREDRVAQAASKVAIYKDLRANVVTFLRDFSKKLVENQPFKAVVMDGRDVATRIFPDAAIKLYISADQEIRADRRMKELQSKGFKVTYEAVLEDMKERDARDMTRSIDPLRPTDTSHIIDTSNMSQEQALEAALEVIRRETPL